ncbi:MAG: hypothetical protein KF855_17040 [Acidobacteria bacterium]|nr:hypothetical protein [Acidobacteriota bacterium]
MIANTGIRIHKKDCVTRKMLFFVLVLCLAPNVFSQSSNSEIVDVHICDLIHQPELYDGKTIRVSAAYRYGFEWSEIFCSRCWSRDKNRIWVSFGDTFENSVSRRNKQLLGIKSTSNEGRTLAVTFHGRFSATSPKDSHASEYSFGFVVEKAEKVRKLFEGSPVPSAFDEKEKKLTAADCKN